MKSKNILIIVLVSAVIVGLAVMFLLLPDQQYSLSERRSLAQKPPLTAEKVLNGKFMSGFEDYTLDQFPGRETLRRVKALTAKYLFRQKDNHGLYEAGGHLSKLEYPLNESRLDRNLDQLRNVYDTLIAPSDCRLFLSVIPDKNCFLAPQYGYPFIECREIAGRASAALPEATYIDITETVGLENFYYTDQHWRQETILDTADVLTGAMGAQSLGDYEILELNTPFLGTYAGQSALPCKPETIRYLRSNVLDSCRVTSYSTGKAQSAFLYDMKKAAGKDPYEMFLGGTDPLIVIENPLCDTGRELVIFRDSFGSSITPLLAESYSKITLVDLRYMKSSLLSDYLTFRDQDVLFLYSTLILNNSIAS